MPFKKGPVEYKIKEDGINELIDEKGNMTVMLREVAWGGRDYHLEIRKWIIDIDKEQPMKGVTFITDEGPNNLVEVMVDKGYGNTEKIITNIKERPDFMDSLTRVIGQKTVDTAKKTKVTITEDDYFDPKSILG